MSGTQPEKSHLLEMGRYLWPTLRREWLRVAFASFCLLAGVLLRLAEPWPLQVVLDHVLGNREVLGNRAPSPIVETWIPTIASLGGFDPLYTLLACCVAGLVLIAMVRAFADYFRTITFTIIGNHALSEVRAQLFRHLQSLSLDFHQRSRNGDLTVRMTGDVNMLKDIAISAALPLFSSCLLLLGMSVVMLWLNWRLGLILLAAFPLFAVLSYRSSRRIHQTSKKQRKREGAMASSVAESLACVRSLQAHGADRWVADSFEAHNRKSHQESAKTSKLTAGLERSVDVQIALATAAVLWFGTQMVLQGTLTAGELVIYLAYLKRGFRPLQDFAKYLGRMSKAAASAERIVEIFREKPTVIDRPDALPAPPLRGEIVLEDLAFGYGLPVSSDDAKPNTKARTVFHGVNLTLPAGSRVAVVGPSGVGKSTLLALLLRLREPWRGTIRLDGIDIRNWTLQSYREQFGIILQENSLFAGSIQDNIAWTSPQASAEEVVAAATVACADEFIQTLPDGYATQIGERGVNLSQGQVQRIAIARAALKRPAILLLDEPTSNLDAESRARVMAALEKITQGRTTLIVTHDLDLAQTCEQILYIGFEGQIEVGTHLDLVERAGSYARLIRSSETNPLSTMPRERITT